MASATVVRGSETTTGRRQGRTTILVVEDEAFVCEVTCDILRHHAYRVLHADDVATAMRLFAVHGAEIDLLLCDATLPNGSGITLAERLMETAPKLKVVITSGYPHSKLDDHLGVGGRAEFLTKPYSASALLTKLRQLVQEDSSAQRIGSLDV